MEKKENIILEESKTQKTKEFVKRNWPIAIALAGAAGALGAAVWLTARYLREKKKLEQKAEMELRLLESEMTGITDPTVAMLEGGSYLGHVAGDEAKTAADELAHNSDDQEAREALETLGHVSQMESRKRYYSVR